MNDDSGYSEYFPNSDDAIEFLSNNPGYYVSHLIDGNDVRVKVRDSLNTKFSVAVDSDGFVRGVDHDDEDDWGDADYKILPFDENTKTEAVGEIMVDLISEDKMAPATYNTRTGDWRIQVDEMMEWIIPDRYMSNYASHWAKKTPEGEDDDVPYRVEVYEYANSGPYGIAEWDESEKIWFVEEYGIPQIGVRYTTDEMLETFDVWKVQ